MRGPTRRQWLREDVGGLQLKAAFTAFKAAWDSFRPSLGATRQDGALDGDKMISSKVKPSTLVLGWRSTDEITNQMVC